MANDLFIIVGAPLLGSSVEQSGNKLIIICNEQKYTINLLVFIRKDSIKLVNLSDVAGVSMTARVDPKTEARTGSQVRLEFDTEKIHIFDKETELVIIN